jgi:cytosine/adenosine deaminase-related metal-dependent hydrolase
MAKKPIDALSGPKYILNGKIVTMDSDYSVINSGNIFIENGEIKFVLDKKESFPEEFKNAPIIKTGGTIYPGLIELHNHLSYNILPLWNVPQKYENRDQWGGTPEYRKLISGPMQVLGKTPGYVEAIVRYVEAKCLLGGTTTSQGIALFSNNGIQKYYRGIVRNVEQTDDPDLPEALSKISDVEAQDAAKFFSRLQKASCLLLHLSEGTNSNAHKHFEALKLSNGEWAIWNSLAGIHCVALTKEDFEIMKEFGASVIWSPLSNLLLYGNTAKIKDAKDGGVLIGLGSDWSPSGSKNIFGEVKIAKLYSKFNGNVFSDRELLELVTMNAAKILKWDKVIGSIEPGKRADLLILKGIKGDPYERFVQSSEKEISLVVINGVPRYGYVNLMKNFGAGSENWRIGRSARLLNLNQDTLDPAVSAISLKEAMNKLKDGMKNLPKLSKELETKTVPLMSLSSTGTTNWFLVLDHNELEGESQRPHLPLKNSNKLTAKIMTASASKPISEVVEPIDLDPLTITDDKNFWKRLKDQVNLPEYIKTGLMSLMK